MSNIETLENISFQVRRDILRMVHKVNSGHPGGSLGCVEFFVSLYFNFMETRVPFEMNGKNEDIFFLSNGHISPVVSQLLFLNHLIPIMERTSFL
jgi:transketolase